MPGDAAEPGAKLLPVAQGRELLPGGDEGFLGDILALAPVAEDGEGDRADEVLVPPHEAGEGVAVARLDAAVEEPGVGGIRDVGGRTHGAFECARPGPR